MKYLFMCVVLWSGWYSLAAQTGWSAGGQVGLRHYRGDLSQAEWPQGPSTLAPTAQLYLERHLRPAWGVVLQGEAGWLQGSSRPFTWEGAPAGSGEERAQALNFRTQTASLSLQLSWHPLARLSRRWDPYLRAGAGYMVFAVYGDLFAADGSRYHYWDDGSIRSLSQVDPEALSARFLTLDGRYETRLDGLQTEGVAYAPHTWVAPLHVGLRYRLSERVHLGLEASLTLSGSDYLDDVSGRYLQPPPDNALAAYAANPGGVDPRVQPWRGQEDGGNDSWFGLGISLSYRFARRYSRFQAVPFYAGGWVDSLATPAPEATVPAPADTQALLMVRPDSLALPPRLEGAPGDSLSAVALVAPPRPDSTAAVLVSPALAPAPLPQPVPDSQSQPVPVPVQVILADSSRPASVSAPAPALAPAAPSDYVQSLWQAQLTAQAAQAEQLARVRERIAVLEAQLGQATGQGDSVAYWKQRALTLEGAMSMQNEQQNELRRQLRHLEAAATQPAYAPPVPAPTPQPAAPEPVTDTLGQSAAPESSLPVRDQAAETSTTIVVLPMGDTDTPSRDSLVAGMDSLVLTDSAAMLPAPPRPPVVLSPVVSVSPRPVPAPDSLRPGDAPAALRPAEPAAPPQLVLGIAQASIFFDKGRKTLLPADEALLDDLVTTLHTFSQLQVRLYGFADKTGNPALNLRLSQERAGAVQAYLEAQGIAPSRVETHFFGDKQTRYQSGALDRRVDIELVVE